MLLTIDVGNSRIKVAVFEHNKQVDFFIFETNEALKNFKNIYYLSFKYSSVFCCGRSFSVLFFLQTGAKYGI